MEKLYFIVANNVPATKVHESMRLLEWCEPEGGYSFPLSPNGRITQRNTSIAYFYDINLANQFLSVLKPIVENRGWKGCSLEICSKRSDKWSLRKLDDTAEKVRNFISKNKKTSKRKLQTSITDNFFILRLLSKDGNFIGYVGRKCKGKIIITPNKFQARCYKTEKGYLKFIDDCNLNLGHVVEVESIDSEAMNMLNDERHSFWNLVMGRK